MTAIQTNDNNTNKLESYTNIKNKTMTLTQLSANNVIDERHFTLFATNIRSIGKNLDELQIVLESMKTKLSIIILGECWLKDNDHIEEINSIGNYTPHYTKINKNKNDGVVVFLNSNIKQYKITEIQVQTMTGLIIDLEKENLLILAIYRSPNTNVKNFVKDLKETVMSSEMERKKRIIVAGDVNIDIRTQNENSNLYITTMAELGLIPLINQYTRVTKETSTCIDHIFFQMENKHEIKNTIILQTKMTDHYSTLVSMENLRACKKNEKKNAPSGEKIKLCWYC